jgi:surface polysaccharide O-acyltransferase-like enzyme
MSEKLAPAQQKSARSWGVDLLRVVSTVMIVAVHILTQGGVLENATGAAWYAAWLLRALLIVDVNCFALISGYVAASSRFKLLRIIMMWLQVWGISVAVSVVFRLLGLCALSPAATLLPVLFSRWWYVTAYFALCPFIPFIGLLFENIGKKQAKLLVFSVFLVFTIAPSLVAADVFKLHAGYSTLWLALLALVGAYIKKFPPFPGTKWRFLALWLGCSLVSFAVKAVLQNHPIGVGGVVFGGDWMMSFTSPPTLLGAAALLVFFSRLELSGAALRFTKFFAPASFGVYLLHVHPCVWNVLLAGAFVPLLKLPAALVPLAVLISAAAVFFVCAIVEKLRALVYKLLRVGSLAEFVGAKLTKLGDRVFGEEERA